MHVLIRARRALAAICLLHALAAGAQPIPATEVERAAELHAQGRYRQAALLLRAAHAGQVSRLGADHDESLRTQEQLALVLSARGRWQEAEALLRDVHAHRVRAQGADAPDALATLDQLATTLSAQGRHSEAEALHRQRADRHERTSGGAHAATLLARRRLAEALYAQGRHDDAIAVLQDAATQATHTLGAHHAHTLAATHALANAHARAEQADAERLHRQVYEARVATQGAEHPEALLALAHLAESQHGSGRTEEASSSFARAAHSSDAELGVLHPTSVRIRTKQARFLLAAGHWQEALIALRTLEPRLRGREEYDAARMRDGERNQTIEREDAQFVDLVITLAARAPEIAGQYASDVIVRTKYLGAETDAIVEHAARNTGNAELRTLAERVRTRRAALARAAHRVGVLDDEALHRALAGLAADELALAQASHAFATVREHAANVTAARIAAALPAGAVLLDVRAYHDTLHDNTAQAPRYAVAVIAADGTAEVLDLGPIAATREAVRDAADLNRIIDDDAHANARDLYAALFGALDARLAPAARIYIAPDGPLHAVPFHALTLADGRYWIERQPLRVLGSARDLLQPERQHEGDAMLAIGGVDYGRSDSAPTFVPLPGSRREATELHTRWQAQGLPTQLWMDSGASERALRSLRVAPDYLHLATHGFFSDGAETAHMPLAASGIALAGANAPAATTDNAFDDGLLYAEEVLDLPLDGTELVVLSACDTARGVDAGWEGSLGLVRALRTAGARNVISTLWQISDEYAAPFMQAFYARLLADPKRDAALALRATQLEWIASAEPGRSYPENWAPFVLVQRR